MQIWFTGLNGPEGWDYCEPNPSSHYLVLIRSSFSDCSATAISRLDDLCDSTRRLTRDYSARRSMMMSAVMELALFSVRFSNIATTRAAGANRSNSGQRT